MKSPGHVWGVGVIVEAATDNKNRTRPNPHLYKKSRLDRAEAFLHVSSQGPDHRSALFDRRRAIFDWRWRRGEELTNQEDAYLIITAPDQLYAVAEALKKASLPEAKVYFHPRYHNYSRRRVRGAADFALVRRARRR